MTQPYHDRADAASKRVLAALIALRDAVQKSGKLNGREYDGLGIQVNNAIKGEQGAQVHRDRLADNIHHLLNDGHPDNITVPPTEFDALALGIVLTVARLRKHRAPDELDTYDAGLLGGTTSYTVEDWHDYIRSELAQAHDFYQSQIDGLNAAPEHAHG